jgi:hypothetical protein
VMLLYTDYLIIIDEFEEQVQWAEHSLCKVGLAYGMTFSIAKTKLISVSKEICSKAVIDNRINE